MMNAACLDLGVPPPTTACFTFGVWAPKVPGSPTRYIQRNFLSNFQGFELKWHVQKCWLGSMSLRGRELHSSLYLGIELKFLTALGGKVLLEGDLPSVEGGQGLPRAGHSQLQMALQHTHHRTQQSPSTRLVALL